VTVIVSAVLALAAAVPAVAATAPLPAPTPRWFASGHHVYVKGLSVPGAVKYQVIGLPNTLMTTIPAGQTGNFMLNTNQAIVVRAVDRYGRTGYNSPGRNPAAFLGWSQTSYNLTGVNIGAFAAANVKFVATKFPQCMAEKAFKAEYDKLRTTALNSENLWGTGGGLLATYYGELYMSFNTSSCEEIKAMMPFVGRVLASAAVAPKTNPVALLALSRFDKPSTWPSSWLPHACYVYLSALGGGTVIRPPSAMVTFRKWPSWNPTDCEANAKRWY